MARESVTRTASAAKAAGSKGARRIKSALQTAAHDGLERLKETTAQLKQTTTGLVENVKERIAARQESPTPEGEDGAGAIARSGSTGGSDSPAGSDSLAGDGMDGPGGPDDERGPASPT